MSIQVNSIDVYTIEERLRKDKDLKDVWDYVKALKRALEMSQETTRTAIGKIREYAKSGISIEQINQSKSNQELQRDESSSVV